MDTSSRGGPWGGSIILCNEADANGGPEIETPLGANLREVTMTQGEQGEWPHDMTSTYQHIPERTRCERDATRTEAASEAASQQRAQRARSKKGEQDIRTGVTAKMNYGLGHPSASGKQSNPITL